MDNADSVFAMRHVPDTTPPRAFKPMDRVQDVTMYRRNRDGIMEPEAHEGMLTQGVRRMLGFDPLGKVKPEWPNPYVEDLKIIAPGTVRITVRTPSTD